MTSIREPRLSEMPLTVLMVAEKPSLAESIAHHLSGGSATKRARGLPVYEFSGKFRGQPAYFRMTSTTGHVFSTNFTSQYQSWEKVDEEALFGAHTLKEETGGAKVVHHLENEVKGCQELVLWLDCDREGENICYEVMGIVRHTISSLDRIWRAKFSAITKTELVQAMNTLGKPNRNLSDSVEYRQELDLKVGCAFTRFQTKFFQGKYGDLDANVVSYGPCQTPTLGFCVQRHDEIVNFRPENFWRIVPTCNRGGFITQFDWHRGRIFDEAGGRFMREKVGASRAAKVTGVSRGTDTKPRPQGLNTVELLKVASKAMGIGPLSCMHTAEHLYTSGYISYPRTESTAYAPSFDLDGTLRTIQSNPLWSDHVKGLLAGARVRPKSGTDMGDHPPITPARHANAGELHGDAWRIYEYVCRHFIASVSPDCKFTKTKITIDMNGEVFTASGKIIEEKGWTVVMPGSLPKDEPMPQVSQGEELPMSEVKLVPGQTRAPDYLTESDLIGLMEKHGIGTDASIATHIQNVCTRNYVTVGAGRTMQPTKLGIILAHGYHAIDPELVLPLVRGQMEAYGTLIAEGKARKDEVLRYALELFRQKFLFFRTNIVCMDSLMEATFSKLANTGKYISRCGICTRYMRHLDARPQRLHCGNCNVTYALPQGGTVKTYFEYRCPADDFEVLICHVDGGKSFPLCPYCYNNPSVEAANNKTMSCAECHHPTCRESLTTNYVCDCIDESCLGAMAFVTSSTGKWKICCNRCPMMIMLPPTANKVKVANQECEDCGARKMSLTFPDGKSPLVSRASAVTACVFCDALLRAHVEEVRGRSAFGYGGGGGRGRGRGRGGGRGGRGGRGGGRGRGRDRDY